MKKKLLGVRPSVLWALSFLLAGCMNINVTTDDQLADKLESLKSTAAAQSAASESHTEANEQAVADSASTPKPSKPSQSKPMEMEFEYVKAVLTDNALTVTILSGESSDRILGSDFPVDYNQPYAVKGLANTYTGLFVGTMGQDVSPYVFLLTDKGAVECVPVGTALMDYQYKTSNALVFTSTGELPNVSNIVSFHEGTVTDEFEGEVVGGYATVFAVDADGYEHDLSNAYYFWEHPEETPPTAEQAIALLDNDHDVGQMLLDSNMKNMAKLVEGEVLYQHGDFCTVVTLGTDHEDQFVREARYAVAATGAIYSYDVVMDTWTPANLIADLYAEVPNFNDLFAIIMNPNTPEYLRFSDDGIPIHTSEAGQSAAPPLMLLPLRNGLQLRVERMDAPYGEKVQETFFDGTVSRGEVYLIDTERSADSAALRVTAVQKEEPSDVTAVWFAEESDSGEDLYLQYITGYTPEELPVG